jgi:glycosyltransferase involved in cell wall biosynthesis
MDKNSLGILQVNTSDCSGGAARIAWNLFKAFEKEGHKSYFAVGFKQSNDPAIIQIPRPKHLKIADHYMVKNISILRSIPYYLDPWRTLKIMRGMECYDFPGTWDLLNLIPHFHPDILHCHNLHGDYFDLRALPSLSEQLPLVLTLHDAWLFSGHCAHSVGCEKWQTGCGKCPDLTLYPRVRKDSTEFNWKQKKSIFARSHLFVATPCRWLMESVKRSLISPAIIESRIIPNGVDLEIFHPSDQEKTRKELHLPETSTIILFAAEGIRTNIWKDYRTMQSAIAFISKEHPALDVTFIALGEEAHFEKIGNARIDFVPYQSDPEKVARYYQASDIYIHAARAETFPNTILEAMACGKPVVATSVGGIPEQIIEGKTGFLTPPGDAEKMARKIMALILDDGMREEMGKTGFNSVREKFSLCKQVAEYLDWYRSILKKREIGQDHRN